MVMWLRLLPSGSQEEHVDLVESVSIRGGEKKLFLFYFYTAQFIFPYQTQLVLHVFHTGLSFYNPTALYCLDIHIHLGYLNGLLHNFPSSSNVLPNLTF